MSAPFWSQGGCSCCTENLVTRMVAKNFHSSETTGFSFKIANLVAVVAGPSVTGALQKDRCKVVGSLTVSEYVLELELFVSAHRNMWSWALDCLLLWTAYYYINNSTPTPWPEGMAEWVEHPPPILGYWGIRTSRVQSLVEWNQGFKNWYLSLPWHYYNRARTGWLSIRIMWLSGISGHGAGGLVSQLGSTIKLPWVSTVTSRYSS